MQVWVVTATTESGDEVGPYVWGHRPLQSEINEVLKVEWPDDFEGQCIGPVDVRQVTVKA